ncbi:MAG: chemotaxis protein CheB [Sphingobacteriales bacterium]|nr:MAG: chemotaxis protein CheB [Sphingobacteriales bacterium]
MTEILVIGGSAGSLQVLRELLNTLPQHIDYAVLIVIHRLKNVASELEHILSDNKTIREPLDKEPIKKGYIYLAPQNYHTLIEDDKTFSLDYSEAVNFSRPSIDVTFESVSKVYGPAAVVVLLSGANNDGAIGIKHILDKNGMAIVQDPATAEYPAMPKAAMEKNKKLTAHSPAFIANYIKAINLFNL